MSPDSPPPPSSLALVVALEAHRVADVDGDGVVGVESGEQGRHVARRPHRPALGPRLRKLVGREWKVILQEI